MASWMFRSVRVLVEVSNFLFINCNRQHFLLFEFVWVILIALDD
jgi:hypothetical protein